MELFSFPAIYDTAFQFRDTLNTIDFIEDCVRMYTDISVNSVVDIACGTGHYTLEFARRGYATYGVDLNEECCFYAQERAKSESLDLHIFCQNMVDFSLPHQCDLAVNFFDSLTYLADPKLLVKHFHSVSHALRSGGLYIVEVGVIDSLDNHNVEEIWTESRRDISVTSRYFRDGMIRFDRKFEEQCSFQVTCREHNSFLLLKYLKMALSFRDFKRIVKKTECFTPLVYFDDFEPTAFLAEGELPWRIVAVLRKQ